MDTTQKNSEVKLTSRLGEDVLLFYRMNGKEALSTLFEYELDILSEKPSVNIDDVLGTAFTVSVVLPKQPGKQRYFNGMVSSFALTGRWGRYFTYQATLRPWLWLLTQNANCRIFQDLSVKDIIKKVLEPYAFAAVDFSMVVGNYSPLDYCVQYRESDFNFISRLMEREGIYYFFEHKQGVHTLILADSVSAHQPASGYENIPFRMGQRVNAQMESVRTWAARGEIQSGSYILNDFDFEKVKNSLSGSLLVKSAIPSKHEHGNMEMFDYPGDYLTRNTGERYAQSRLESLHVQHRLCQAETTARGICSGWLFKLTDHPNTDQNKEYLVIAAHYQIQVPDYQTTSMQANIPELFVAQFSAIDKKQSFRAPLITPQPVAQGPQTAIVTGKSGEEIWTDKYGRVKVKFLWDRYGKSDESSSCWIRLAQEWAGKRWGIISLPRIGQEVIVNFIDGNLDCPIITGSVYNADMMPPYALPSNATRFTIKSNSSKGGGGYNELRFEDKKGSEQVFLHAEKNLDVRVKKDSLEWVGENRHIIVKKNRMEEVGGEGHLKIGGKFNQKIGADLSIQAGANINIKAGAGLAIDAGSTVHIKAGASLVLEAGAMLSLKVGGSFVSISPAAVAISGTPIMLNSGGSAGSGSGCKVSPPDKPKEADEGGS